MDFCESGLMCKMCRNSARWREFKQLKYGWDGVCPKGLAIVPTPQRKGKKTKQTKKAPKATKVCRMGNRECTQYRSCRDTCRITSKRITAMQQCPEGAES